MEPIAEDRKRRICYFFDSDIGNYHYGPGHPMKPHRIRMTHALVMNYGLYKKMEIFRAKPATRKEMAQFHTDDYVEFLSKVTPDNMDGFLKEQAKFNLGDDCPVFDGLFEYCSISAGGSMEGAARLSRDKCDIAVNWAGGLHHAKKAEAGGFCYVNDIVLGILELLRYHKRVLYIDIDVHHGDGVEEAFYTTDRVMTCSFHKYGEFFPGTGELRDIGQGKGKHYAVNFPLRDGITDESYKNIFEPVIMKIMETYQPSAIVLQCGGDSLSGDRLGSFNVSMQGHANCVRFIKSLGLPLLLLGGGGYTIRNVSRTWAYETGLAAGQELCPEIPMNEYYEYFGPTYRLEVPPSNMEDMNVDQYLEKIKVQIFENLRHTIPVPSVGLQPIPRLPHDDIDIDEDLDDLDERRPQRLLDALIQRDDEFSDSEDEGEGGRRDVQSHKRPRKATPQLPQTNGRSHTLSASGLQPPLVSQSSNQIAASALDHSRQSSFSSSASTSVASDPRPRINGRHDRQITQDSLQDQVLSQNEAGAENPPSAPPTGILAPPAIPAAEPKAVNSDSVDVPMLSEADQSELERLADAVPDSDSSGKKSNPELSLQPEEARSRMEIDETVEKSAVAYTNNIQNPSRELMESVAAALDSNWNPDSAGLPSTSVQSALASSSEVQVTSIKNTTESSSTSNRSTTTPPVGSGEATPFKVVEMSNGDSAMNSASDSLLKNEILQPNPGAFSIDSDKMDIDGPEPSNSRLDVSAAPTSDTHSFASRTIIRDGPVTETVLAGSLVDPEPRSEPTSVPPAVTTSVLPNPEVSPAPLPQLATPPQDEKPESSWTSKPISGNEAIELKTHENFSAPMSAETNNQLQSVDPVMEVNQDSLASRSQIEPQLGTLEPLTNTSQLSLHSDRNAEQDRLELEQMAHDLVEEIRASVAEAEEEIRIESKTEEKPMYAVTSEHIHSALETALEPDIKKSEDIVVSTSVNLIPNDSNQQTKNESSSNDISNPNHDGQNPPES